MIDCRAAASCSSTSHSGTKAPPVTPSSLIIHRLCVLTSRKIFCKYETQSRETGFDKTVGLASEVGGKRCCTKCIWIYTEMLFVARQWCNNVIFTTESSVLYCIISDDQFQRFSRILSVNKTDSMIVLPQNTEEVACCFLALSIACSLPLRCIQPPQPPSRDRPP